jgi:nucleoside-diphosphate-sugar epimerase
VGNALAKQLLAGDSDGAHQESDGPDRVWGLRRNAARLAPGVEPVIADLAKPESLTALPSGLDAVVYAAAPGAAARDASQRESAYREVYLDGLELLLRALVDQGGMPKRLIFVSSTAVYGQRRGEFVDEDSPTHPARGTGEILLAAERLALASEVSASVLRLGGIYGPSRTRLIDRVRNGKAVCRRGPAHYTNRIHRDDAAAALRHLLGVPELAPIYLGVDDMPADEADVLRWLAQELGADEPRMLSENEAPALNRAGSKRCRNDRLKATGFEFEYPSFREGYGALLSLAAAGD